MAVSVLTIVTPVRVFGRGLDSTLHVVTIRISVEGADDEAVNIALSAIRGRLEIATKHGELDTGHL